ncbi:MAG TPA: molybdopterin cofactor-binding domain-containing protein, partial [Chroococcales cyanobacterium]
CTVMAQIGADCMTVPLSDVVFELGDTEFPKAPVSGGSATVSTVGNAVWGAGKKLQETLAAEIVAHEASPFKGEPVDNIVFTEGRLTCKNKPGQSLTYDQALRILQKDTLECSYDTQFNDHALKYSTHAFGAQFAKVRVDQDLGEVRVERFVGVFAIGKVINEKTCRSQAQGGITMGIGMALTEETLADSLTGRIINANLGEYHIPVHADVPQIEAYFIPEDDQQIGAIGAKGVGEIGITGVAAAIANAVFNATGKRVRNLPITPDKLLTLRG